MAAALLSWMIAFMWAGVAVWVFFDARRLGRAPLSNALATFLLPGLGFAVYMGTRQVAKLDTEADLSKSGQRLLRELTAEVSRLKAELEAERAGRTKPVEPQP